MVKEFFVVGSDDHSNDNPKIGNTDLRHVSLSLPPLSSSSLAFPLCLCVDWIMDSGITLISVIRKWTSKNGRAC